MNLKQSKKTAAGKALDYVRDGMVVGLGTGSTANYFIEFLSWKIKGENLNLIAISTSKRTDEVAKKLGIGLSNLNQHPQLDLDVDGADEIDPEFNLIKGGGGAHTMEKRIAMAAKKFIVIADSGKLVDRLERAVPVEVSPSARESVEQELRRIGGNPQLRENFLTDMGNLILDTKFKIDDPLKLESELNSIPGVVDNGIFARRRPEIVIIGYGENVKILERQNGR